MADDHDFKSVRRNFFIINILIFFLAAKGIMPPVITVLGTSITLHPLEIIIAFSVFYAYYAFRYYQEFKVAMKEIHIDESESMTKFFSLNQNEFKQLANTEARRIGYGLLTNAKVTSVDREEITIGEYGVSVNKLKPFLHFKNSDINTNGHNTPITKQNSIINEKHRIELLETEIGINYFILIRFIRGISFIPRKC